MWEPGQTGNPDGAKKPRKFLAALERALAVDGGEKIRRVAEKLIDSAMAGEPWAIQMLADRLDGKPVQQISADSDGGAVAIALVAYHPAQLHSQALPAPSTNVPRLGD